MAGTLFLDAEMCPWTQGLNASRLSSIAGIRGFQIRVVLLLDWLPAKVAEIKEIK